MTSLSELRIKDLAYDILEARQPRRRIPYAGAVYDIEEILATLTTIKDSFTTGWFAFGKKCREFEQKFAEYVGASDAVFVNSGSSANLLAIGSLVALGDLKHGDEIITPATTFPTTINAMLMYGLKPVLVDVDFPSYTVSLENIRKCTSRKTKAIFLVHLCGSASDLGAIVDEAFKRNWLVLQDACDALGTKINLGPSMQVQAGVFSTVGTYSFYVAHQLTTFEGGALVSNHKEILETARSLRDWGRASGSQITHNQQTRIVERASEETTLPTDYEARYSYITRGFNLKPIEVQGAVGLAQLDKLDKFTEIRQQNYRRLLLGLEPFVEDLILPFALKNVEPSWWAFPITIWPESKIKRKDLTDHLEKDGIETRPLLAGDIRKQPAFANVDFRVPQPLPNTETILTNTFFVGCYPGLGDKDMDKIIDSFKRFFDFKRLFA